jgi:hypothetical protein
VNIVWITAAGNDPHYTDAPTQMAYWSSDDLDGQVRWNSFVRHFNLRNVGDDPGDPDGPYAPYDNQSIYFLPD